MIKILIKETRTLPVPESLVDTITRIYRGAFIKLVVDFIEKQLGQNSNLSRKYNLLLDAIQKKYSIELSDSQTLGFIRDLNVDTVIADGELIESIPVEQFIMALLAWPELETYVRGRIKPQQLKTRLKRYFKNKGVDDIQFNIEFGTRGTTTQKDYAGLYQPDIDAINITFNASFFTPTPTDYKDRRGNLITAEPGLSVNSRKINSIVENIDTELEDTRASVRHELQHLFQNLMSTILKTNDWSVGLPSKDILNKTSSDQQETPHHLQSIEMQTDLQDEVDKFLSYVKKFKEKNPDKLRILPQVVKIFIKLFTDSKLTSEENKFADDNDLKIYIFPSELLRTIKYSKKANELYNYASQLLYNSVKNEIPQIDPLTIPLSQRYDRALKESFSIHKIKIILK